MGLHNSMNLWAMPCRATQDGWVTVESSEKMLSTGGRTEGRNINNLRYVDQFSSVTQWCLKPCHPMDCSTPGFPVHHQLPQLVQTHIHQVGDAIQPSNSLLSPSSSAFNLSQHQGLLQWVSSSYQVTQVLELQHQSFQWIFRIDFLMINWLDLLAVQGTLKSLLQSLALAGRFFLFYHLSHQGTLPSRISPVSETKSWDFSSGPVVKMPHFHCKGHGFDSWAGN